MTNTVFFTRQNKEESANIEDVKRFEKSALSDIGRGKVVYIFEKYPKKFFHLATKIRIEKVEEKLPGLSEKENNALFKVFLTGRIFD